MIASAREDALAPSPALSRSLAPRQALSIVPFERSRRFLRCVRSGRSTNSAHSVEAQVFTKAAGACSIDAEAAQVWDAPCWRPGRRERAFLIRYAPIYNYSSATVQNLATRVLARAQAGHPHACQHGAPHHVRVTKRSRDQAFVYQKPVFEHRRTQAPPSTGVPALQCQPMPPSTSGSLRS